MLLGGALHKQRSRLPRQSARLAGKADQPRLAGGMHWLPHSRLRDERRGG